jgi:hypothetical protein
MRMTPKANFFYSLLLGVSLALGLSTCIMTPQKASAQAGLGTLTGVITDPSKAVVPNATVTLANKGTGFSRTATTNATGVYRFVALEVTSGYVLRVSAPGFKDAELKGITTSVGTVISADVALQVGAAGETVEVSSDVNVEQVQTETSSVSQLIDATVWKASPLEVRSQNAFVTLVAGATPDSGTENGGTSTGRGAAVFGARTGTGNFMVDGMDNNDQGQGGAGAVNGGGAVTTISPDAIQEYRVITHIPPAEYGRAGGFATDTVLKSGTKTWHGSLFEYNRIQKLASEHYFTKREGLKDHLVRNQFGGSIGGPIYKDRTFFFATTEFHRMRQGSPVTGTVTTQDFLNFVQSGAFETFMEGTTDQNTSTTATLGVPTVGICPYYLGTTCPGALSGSSKLGTVFQTLLAAEPTAFPVGTTNATPIAEGLYTGGSIAYPVNVYATTSVSNSEVLNQNRGTMKVDHRLTEKDQLSFAYLIDLFEDTTSNGASGGSSFGPAGGSLGGAQNFSATWTHTFSPSLLNLFRAGYLRHVSNFSAPGTEGVPQLTTWIDLNSGFGAYSGFPQLFTENEFLYSDQLTKTLQHHTLKFGFQFIRTRNGSSFYNDIYGSLYPWDVENLLTDATLYDQFEQVAGGATYGSLAYATASIDPTTNEAPDPYRGFRAKEFAAFAQDDWKVTSRLTINAGLRWDYFGPPHNFRKGYDSNVYFGAFGTPTTTSNPYLPNIPLIGGLQTATFQQRDSQIWNKDVKSFGPRFGFSYDVTGKGTLAIRGGYGIGFDRLYNNVYENIRFNYPHFSDNSIGYEAGNVLAGALLQNGLYAVPFTANALFSSYGGKPVPRHIDQRLRNAYYEQYNLGFEYQLKAGYVVEADYVGTLGRQLVSLDNINTFAGRTACPTGTYAPGSACYEAGYPNGFTTARPTSLFNNDNFRTNGFSSNYNGLATSLRKGYSNGLQFTLNYTYSKALDQVSDVFTQRNGVTGPTNPYDRAYDYGPADFDMRHNLVLTMNYETSWKKDNLLLGGWGISPILKLQSGTPFTSYSSSGGYNPIKDGRTGIDRTVYTGTGSPKNSINHDISPANGYLKAGSFAEYQCPTDMPWCEPPIGRNTITGPAYKDLDLGVSKHFKTFENQGFTFTGSFFNIFNHANFANPNANTNSSAYGLSESTGDPRITQLSLRYDF